MNLIEISSFKKIDIGAPDPTLISNGTSLYLFYYYHNDQTQQTQQTLIERDSVSDTGIASLTFNLTYIHKFGFPNDEVLMSHALYTLGLDPYSMYEVQNSDWISHIEKMNSVHPLHDPSKFKTLKHFLLSFKDATFECIAKSVDITYFPAKTLKEAVIEILREIPF